MSCFTGCINTCKECFSKQDEKENEITLQSDKKEENNNNNKGDNQLNKENNANNVLNQELNNQAPNIIKTNEGKASLLTFADNGIINTLSDKENDIITAQNQNNNSSTFVVKNNQMSTAKTQNVINFPNSINKNNIQNTEQNDTNIINIEPKVETRNNLFKKLFPQMIKNGKTKTANQKININQQYETKLEQNNNININDNDDNLLKLINDLNEQEDEKDATNIKNAKNKDKKAKNKNLKFTSNNINENQNIYNNKLKQQPSQKKHTGNKNIPSEPSQTPKEIQKTDTHLHNFLTKIVIKICELEESFCKDNNVDCSKFWKNLVGGNKKTFETKDNLFTKVLNRNYNHYNICNNNHTLRLLGNNFGDIKGTPTTSEIVNQMVRQKSCEQLERILRISDADRQQLKKKQEQKSIILGTKTLTDPMLTEYLKGECINKATEIMLMLMHIQDVAFDIYKKSKKQEKQHAKNILLFFRQVLTTLSKNKIIQKADCRDVFSKNNFPANNEDYWNNLLKDKKQYRIIRYEIKGHECEYIDFELNNKEDEIQQIDLKKLFWKNGKQFDVKGFHYTPAEIANYQQCINEHTKFKLDNSIMLDEIKK